MSPTETVPGIESLSVNITQEIHVNASLETTFEALLEQLGPENETPERKMPMKLEAWPGGRWYRDLGDGNGHFWGHVQAIKRPTLLEFTGPLFMSHAVANNLQYRLSEEDGGTLIRFQHKAFGVIPEDHRRGMNEGWGHMHARIKAKAEAKKK
ncbi:MAG: SRPBCC family protein [Candidatus Sulfotelmatobacter sp.]